MSRDEYVTLMASLPALGPILAARHPPINTVRLEARLSMLRPEHRAELAALSGLLAWRHQALDGTDSGLVARARRVIPRLSSPTLAGLARERLELRTVVAALRRRHAGQEAPPEGIAWGYGRFVRRIRDNWQEPGLGVARAFPWVLAAKEKLEAGEATALERILLEAAWRQAERRAVGHAFDFEAVALYAVRWKLLERWTRYDAEGATARFRRLAGEALDALPARLAPGVYPTEAA